MTNVVDIDSYSEVRECDYKGEHYSVRDNGAIMRHSQRRKRPSDGIWTFGKKDSKTGYMLFGSARVHIIVATAFFGEHDSAKLVVDHQDTNRCNNRPENLRWITRLENALNNPATLKKIIFLCGGDIQKFLDDPSCLRDITGNNQDVMWMRTVSAEEAKNAYENIMRWAHQPSSVTPSYGGKMGEWLYEKHNDGWQPDYTKKDRPNVPSENETKPKYETVQNLKFTSPTYGRWDTERKIEEPLEELPKTEEETKDMPYSPTSNPLAVQIGWKSYSNPEFPCCPKEIIDNPLQEYEAKLTEGAIFITATYGNSIVYKHIIYKNLLLVITKIPNGVKAFGLAKVTWNGEVFIHESMGTYFEENGALAAYTIAQDKEWDGPDCIDFYCD